MPVEGLHHITSLARDPAENNRFFTQQLGLRRVKKTVNFDSPDIYHLYYGNAQGAPGSILTYFPFPMMAGGRYGAGEVGIVYFTIPRGSLAFWQAHLSAREIAYSSDAAFGAVRLLFNGPDGESFALIESDVPAGAGGWAGQGVPEEMAIAGLNGASLRLHSSASTAALLELMGYQETDQHENMRRFRIFAGNGARVIDLESRLDAPRAREGAGSVHHIAFAVKDRAAQLEMRKGLREIGYATTPVIDRGYFWAVYFRGPEGILFEIATNEPGFAIDEDREHLGEALKLPAQYEHLRAYLEQTLPPLT